NTQTRGRQAGRTAGCLETQLGDVKKQLDDQERHASQFRLAHIGELPQQVDANLASLERLNTKLRLNGEQQLRAMERRERLEKQLNESATAAPIAPPTSPAAAELSR